MRPAVVERLTDRLYGRPIIRNVLRGELVEQMVLDALGEGWREAPDYEVWDVQSADGAIKIQIKQSAARQSWSEKQAPATLPRFSIEPSRAWTEADGRAAEAARHAALYIFAWHPRIDETADHRDSSQWQFHVVATAALPASKSIGLNKLRCLADVEQFDTLKIGVNRVLMLHR